MSLQDSLILQGPPGTGKTYLIAEICERLCNQGKSVLVTALTNRALIEIVEKPALKGLLEQHRIFKTKLSVDEARAFKDLATKNKRCKSTTLQFNSFNIFHHKWSSSKNIQRTPI